jgi:hypothetical protein
MVFSQPRWQKGIHQDPRPIQLEIGTVQAFEAPKGTEHERKHLQDLLTPIDDIECPVADPAYYSPRNCWLPPKREAHHT